MSAVIDASQGTVRGPLGKSHSNSQPSIGDALQGRAFDAARKVGELKLPELILSSLLVVEVLVLGLPVPFNTLVVIALVVLALLRTPTVALGRIQLLVPLLIVAMGYIALVSMFADRTELAFDWKRRFVRLAVIVFFMLVIASGRLHVRSLVIGVSAGLIVNAILFYAGIAPADYGSALSGYLADKNVAGLSYCVYGILLVAILKTPWHRAVVVLLFAGLLWETESRTSIAAFSVAIGWLFIAPHIRPVGRWILGIISFFVVTSASEDYSEVGVFSDRTGSDLLRSRIDAASQVKVDGAGFFGRGLGEGYVILSGNKAHPWLFHNSYWTALVEGGWPWLIVVFIVMGMGGLYLFRGKLTRGQVAALAVSVAILVCAWRLGEVFFTIPWAVAMGFGLQQTALVDAEQDPDSGADPNLFPVEATG